MTTEEFDLFRAETVRDYAASHVDAGNWSENEGEARASAEMDQLLPQGAATDGMLVCVAETSAGVVGRVWIALERRPGTGRGAWIYGIEVVADRRGRGYGRALLEAAEREAARHGVQVIGLHVFGANAVARRLYESAGYEITSIQMRKRLLPSE